MAFMMPVFKNDYDIYASKSRRSSSASMPRSRRSTRSDSNPPSLSCSPNSDVEERLATVLQESARGNNSSRRVSRNEAARSRSGSQFNSTNSTESDGPPSPKSASQTSLHKFHSRLVDKLKKSFRMKGDDQGESSKNATS